MAAVRDGLRYHRLWLASGWGLVGLLVYLSLTPDPPTPFEFHLADKLYHTLAYGLLMGWFMQLYLAPRPRAVVATLLIALGIVLEFLQAQTAVRTFDVVDMTANSVGVLLTWALLPARGAHILWAIERALPRM